MSQLDDALKSMVECIRVLHDRIAELEKEKHLTQLKLKMIEDKLVKFDERFKVGGIGETKPNTPRMLRPE